MSNLSQFSTTAANNNSASPDGFPEGMAPSGLNDSARELMAAIAKQYTDQKGTITTGGTTTAYTLTTNNAHTALTDISLFAFQVNATNTGAATLSVDGLAAKSMNLGGTALVAGDINTDEIVLCAYNPDNDVLDIFKSGLNQSSLVFTGTDNVEITHASTPQLKVTDTTNTTSVILRSTDTTGVVGTNTSHDLIILAGDSTAATVDQSDQSWTFAGDATFEGGDLTVQAAASGDPRINLNVSGTGNRGFLIYDDSANDLTIGNTHVADSSDVFISTRNGTHLFEFGGDGVAVFPDQLTINGTLKFNATAASAILGNDADQSFAIGSSTTSNLGANIFLYPESHATQAGDIVLRSDTTTVLNWDESAGTLNISNSSFDSNGQLDVYNQLEIVGPGGTITRSGTLNITADDLNLTASTSVMNVSASSCVFNNGIGVHGVSAPSQASHIADPSGGSTQDAEARAAINSILTVLENLGFTATS